MPGQIVGGNYEIVEKIGEGGMAMVYKATQKSLNRPVAIKALHPRFCADASFIERFAAESGALATLSHANIITIIDRGSEGSVYFFVMEYVDGEDLDKKIVENRLTSADWKKVIASCRDALEYIHKRGVVHRDIKPSNILVNSDGQVKLGDFGIAHIVTGDAVAEATGSGGPIGTTHYMAPEQANDSGNVDHRADIYSLAVAFYKMMARRMPVGEFAAPSEVNNEIPVAVDAVIFQAMAPNREDRYQSAAEFCDDLLKALKDQSVSITSLFNRRSTSTSSSLYSGTDFRKGSAGSASSSEVKKSPETTRPPSAEQNRVVPSGKTLPPIHRSPSTSATGVLLRGGASAPPAEKPVGANKIIRIVTGLLFAGLVIGLGVLAIISFSSDPPDAVAPTPMDPATPLTGAISPARERELREAENLRLREQEVTNATLESDAVATPTPPPEQMER